MVDYVGMATGTPPEVIKSKYSTSYTAHKGALNDFERNFLARREAFIDTVCWPVLREVAVSLILRGELDAPGFFESERAQRAYLDGNWRGPSLGHINPAQEINALVNAVNAKLMTKSEAAYRVSSITDYEAFSTRWKYDEGLFPAAKRGELARGGSAHNAGAGKAEEKTGNREQPPEKAGENGKAGDGKQEEGGHE
jgi:capsid protein